MWHLFSVSGTSKDFWPQDGSAETKPNGNGAVRYSCWGNVMSKRLSADDRHAVDLILERPDGQGDKPLVEMVFARPVKEQFEERLDNVEKILSVLDAMPAPEPSDDLVSRTMARIKASQLEPNVGQTPLPKSSRSSARPT